MKTFLAVVGALSLLLLAVAGIFFAHTMYAGEKLDQSSKAYIDIELPLIVSHWSKDLLIQSSSAQLRQAASSEQIGQLFSQCESHFGPMVSYDGCNGQSHSDFNLQPTIAHTVTADYTAKATFQNAKGTFHLKLILEDNTWKFLGFHVD